MGHAKFHELMRAARDVAAARAEVRDATAAEYCSCGRPAVIVLVTADGALPYCGDPDEGFNDSERAPLQAQR